MEYAEIKIPSSEWLPLKRAVQAAFNEEQERRREVALKLREMLKEKGVKDRSGFVAHVWLQRLPLSLLTRPGSDQVIASLFSDKTEALIQPRKKEYPPATSATHEYDLGTATLSFADRTRVVTWSAEDEEAAHAEPVARAFFTGLEEIGRRGAWTEQSGGLLLDAAGEARTEYGPGRNKRDSGFVWRDTRVHRDSYQDR